MAVARYQAYAVADHVTRPPRPHLATLNPDPAGYNAAPACKRLENLFLPLPLEAGKPDDFAAP